MSKDRNLRSLAAQLKSLAKDVYDVWESLFWYSFTINLIDRKANLLH